MFRARFRTAIILVATIITVAGCQTAEVKKTPLTATDSGRFGFPTTALEKGKKVIGVGTLKLPGKSSGKVPLVILAHGTKGVGYREHSWSGFLNDQGYATFILDYFTPRGVDGSGRYVPRPPEDVWGAIKYLSTHPSLDMKKVAVMGFSNGGSVTRSSAMLDPKKDTNGVLPKAFIMFYGGCHTPIYMKDSSYNPALLYVAGGKDKLVTADTCLQRKSDASSKDIDVMVIDGAYHLFDGDKSLTFTHRKWGTITVKADRSATEQARKKVTGLLKRVF